ncbi:acyltransferase [Winogradskyella schleiferi]|uniref:acyltransferase n=1 Tax=Winogradskyella schleiferi TaxID=2686078 RepID=UPI0015B9C6B6|nr:acyltransferase [Winogradskyella schleiferi]
MKVIFILIKYTIQKWLRIGYWLFRLSKASFGCKPNLSFPIKMEGNGKVFIGDFAVLKEKLNIGVGNKANLTIGNNCLLEERATILVQKSIKFVIGDNFKLGAGAKLYVNNNWHFSDDVKIETNCCVFAREPDNCGLLIINKGSRIGDYTIIDVVDDISIGENVAIGPNCIIYTHDHVYTNRNVPAWKGGLVKKPIIIEDGAWIGSGVTILPGVIIGKRAVVAAGSVVTKNIEAESIYGGIPAKFIKKI